LVSAEIEAAIDAADAFLFVMSQNSIASAICRKELEHATGRNKRLVPIMRHEWEDQPVPEALARINWIFLREGDDFAAGVDTLIEALDTDLEHVNLHTRYLQRAVDWERKGTGKSYALRGQDLIAAETWLAESGGKEPRPTSAQNRYVLESRRVTTLRQRMTAGAVSFGVLVATVLGLLGAQARAAGLQNQRRSIANQLVGESRLAREEQEDRLEESVQLAVEAMRRFDALGEHSLAADQELRTGLAILPQPPEIDTVGAPGLQPGWKVRGDARPGCSGGARSGDRRLFPPRPSRTPLPGLRPQRRVCSDGRPRTGAYMATFLEG
jgi:hypothetical protein